MESKIALLVFYNTSTWLQRQKSNAATPWLSDYVTDQWSSSRHLCSHSVQTKKRVSLSSAARICCMYQ